MEGPAAPVRRLRVLVGRMQWVHHPIASALVSKAGKFHGVRGCQARAVNLRSRAAHAPAFLKAMHDVRLSHGPIGPVRLDEYGTPILDIYVRKVARVNGKLANTILKTYPQVSQFWTYDPAQFVTQPPFSRDYPASKNLE